MNKIKTRCPWLWGLIVFAITIAVMIFVCAPIQYALGLWGVAITELILLGLALGGMAFMRYPPRETFPLRKPRANQVVGTVVMMLSAQAVNVPLTVILLYFFPEGFQITESISQLTRSLPLPVAWIIIALFPAVCEEALHRGFLFRTFRSIRSKWAVVGLGGLLFGIFHLDPFRFLSTALLGAVITYIMVETDNILLPFLYHMANNTLSVLAGQIQPQDASLYLESLELFLMPSVIGIYLIYGAFGVLALRGGGALIGFRNPSDPPSPPEELPLRKKRLIRSWVITGGIALGMMVAGAVLFATDFESFFNFSMTQFPQY